MRSFRILLVILLASVFVLSAFADDFWEKKPYQKWSKQETDKMLSDSPWTKHISLGQAVIAGSAVSGANAGAVNLNRTPGLQTSEQEGAPHLTYTLQLRSAKPIREAVVRQRQLQERYDSMSSEQKAALDAKTNAYLAAPQDDIVVYVTYDSNVRNYVDELRRFWTQQNYDLLKNRVCLIVGKERYQLSGYAFTTNAFQFNFPRPQGLTPDDTIMVDFFHPGVGAINADHLLVEFKVNKMTFEGAPAL